MLTPSRENEKNEIFIIKYATKRGLFAVRDTSLQNSDGRLSKKIEQIRSIPFIVTEYDY
jgi:hypothetical protein